MELGKAYVQVIPSTKGIKGQLEQEFANSGSSSGSKFGGAFKGVLSRLAIGAVVAKGVKDAFKEGAALEQSIGGIETLFKNSSDKMKEYASNAWKTAGLSANQYMETSTSFSASLLQSLKGDTKKAAETSNMAITDMADNANKMGTSMQSIQDAYQGFAKQNYTMLDNLKLGYGGTKTEMERLLKDAQKLTGVKYDINNLNDVYSAIHAIQGELGITGTTAKEATETLSGSFASLKATYKDLLGNLLLGKDLKGPLNNFVQSIITVTKNVIPAIVNIVKSLPNAILGALAKLAPEIGPMLTNLIVGIVSGLADNLGEMLSNIASIRTGLVNGLLAAIPKIIEAMPKIIEAIVQGLTQGIPKLIESAVQVLGSIVKALPQVIQTIVTVLPQIIDTIIKGLLEAIPMLIETGLKLFVALIEALPQIIVTIVEALPQIITGIITALVNNIPLIIQTGIKLFVALIKALPQIIVAIVKAVPSIVKGIVKGFLSLAGAFVDIGIELIKGIGRGLWEGVKYIGKSIIGVGKKIKDKFCSFFGIKSPSRLFAELGGYLTQGLAIGIESETGLVEKAMDKVNSLINPSAETELAYKISDNAYKFNANSEGNLNENQGNVINQTININQPVTTPSDTARALRREAVMLGLAGAR